MILIRLMIVVMRGNEQMGRKTLTTFAPKHTHCWPDHFSGGGIWQRN